jgi:hypothetical protein
MSKRKHRRAAIGVLVALLIVVFATTAFAGIATSPLGVKQPSIFAGLGSCPLGSPR